MGRVYKAPWNATNTQSTTVPIMTLTGSAAIRVALKEYTIGSDATPANMAATYLIRRHSTAPAGGTAITPKPKDSADPACVATAMMGPSIGAPTLGDTLDQLPLNQNSSFRWVADDGRGFVVPATANNGLSLLPIVVNGSAVNVVGMWSFEE